MQRRTSLEFNEWLVSDEGQLSQTNTCLLSAYEAKHLIRFRFLETNKFAGQMFLKWRSKGLECKISVPEKGPISVKFQPKISPGFTSTFQLWKKAPDKIEVKYVKKEQDDTQDVVLEALTVHQQVGLNYYRFNGTKYCVKGGLELLSGDDYQAFPKC